MTETATGTPEVVQPATPKHQYIASFAVVALIVTLLAAILGALNGADAGGNSNL